MELTPALRLRGVTLSFRGLSVLDGVSFEVQPEEIVALIGPNGAGKTSVFNVISSLYQPRGGRIEVFGTDVTQLPARRMAGLGVARTFQNLNLFPTMTVAENVLLGRHLHRRGGVARSVLGLNRRDDRNNRAEVDEVLDLCDLAALADAPVVSLPYGAQKRVELARAVASAPKLLLLDEPAAGMNESEKQGLAAVVARTAQALRCAVLVVEHDIPFVRSLSGHFIVLDFGTVIADGEPADVLSRTDVRVAYLGEGAVA